MTQTVPEAPVAPGGHAVRVEEVPDPQVDERASRRTYTAKYKLEVLAEYERLDKAGKGALLRREGLYKSLISAWREQRDRGALAALEATSRRPRPADPQARENERLVAENARLAAELDQAWAVVRVQGELSALLAQLSKQSADRPESEPEQ
jgi:transposase